MFKKPLLIIISVIFLFLISFLIMEKPHSPREVTFAPLFQILGKFVQTADATFSRILAGGEWDEAQFGRELKKRFDNDYEISVDSLYLNELLGELTKDSRKSFDYKIYVDPYMSLNAYAMAGGVIVFSAELLDFFDNEAQIAAIIAHEVAHIELDHCLNAVKFELAADEYNLDTQSFFSRLYNILISISFSKTEEDEADDYAFNLILHNTDYWPQALSDGFDTFIEAYGESGNNPLLVEFFQSHPDMEYRRDKYRAKAESLKGKDEKYIGITNLDLRIPMTEERFEEEWKNF